MELSLNIWDRGKKDEEVWKQPWPANLDEAVNAILQNINEEQKETILNTSEKDIHLLHFTLGTFIRANFGLWEGNWDLMESCHEKDPYTTADVIVKTVWAKLKEQKHKT